MNDENAVRMVTEILGPIITSGPHAFKNAVLRGLPCHQINGRQIVGYVPVTDGDGTPLLKAANGHREVVTRRARFTIPKHHPWRGRPRAEYEVVT